MKQKVKLLLILIVMSGVLQAQQITQQFTFSQSELKTTQSGTYDIVSLPETDFLQGEENAGQIKETCEF